MRVQTSDNQTLEIPSFLFEASVVLQEHAAADDGPLDLPFTKEVCDAMLDAFQTDAQPPTNLSKACAAMQLVRYVQVSEPTSLVTALRVGILEAVRRSGRVNMLTEDAMVRFLCERLEAEFPDHFVAVHTQQPIGHVLMMHGDEFVRVSSAFDAPSKDAIERAASYLRITFQLSS